MLTIELDVLPWLSQALEPGRAGHRRRSVRVGGDRLRDLLSQLAAQNEAFARLVYDSTADAVRYPVRVVINGRLAELNGGLEAPLAEGDTVTIMAAYTGG